MKTPQQLYPELAKIIGVNELYLKREDLHKYGSHKGRSIPLMIKTYVKTGTRDFVISSSGNAALAAILATEQHNKNNEDKQITLRVFVGYNIDPKKLKRLQDARESSAVHIEQVDRPRQEAFLLDRDNKAKFLRQSTDDTALEGYAELGLELLKIPNLAAVFIPTSSGTTAQAVAQVFLDRCAGAVSCERAIPAVHIVQTTAHHPIAQYFDTDFQETDTSIAGAIVDNVAHRRDAVVENVAKTNGGGWIPSDAEIKEAKKFCSEYANVRVSGNGALGVAGLLKAVRKGVKFTGPVVCLVCGE